MNCNLVTLLQSCATSKDLSTGVHLHSEILKTGLLAKDPFVASALVNMYAKCGVLARAKEVLLGLPVRSVVAWSVLITRYTQGGYGEEALECFEMMQNDDLLPDAVTYGSALRACGNVGALRKGEKIHAEISRQGLLDDNVVLGGALVDMYAKCGALLQAKEVLDWLATRNEVTWCALIAGYAKAGHGKEALDCFDRMQHEGLSPDSVTFGCILRACGSLRSLNKGKELHFKIVRQDLLGANMVLGSALVDMYVKCGALTKAKEVLEELPVRNVVLWSALIAGYAEGQGEEALTCFEQMWHEGFHPNPVTYACVLKACGSIGAVHNGEEICLEIVRQGLHSKHVVLGNALIDMFAKCGALDKSREVLEGLPVHDVISWNALIAGYVQHGQNKEALNSFEGMQREGLLPNTVTFACTLKACGSIGAIHKGNEVYMEILRHDLLCKDAVLNGAVVDMYARCGALVKAKEVFDGLSIRDVISWSALITGYAQAGHGKEALECFEWMHSEGLLPNEVTFLSLLTACSHSGLLGEGEQFCAKMSREYGIVHSSELGTCMIDLFARTGLLDRAVAFIKEMPTSYYPPMWCALISGCFKWGDLTLGRWAFDQALQVST